MRSPLLPWNCIIKQLQQIIHIKNNLYCIAFTHLTWCISSDKVPKPTISCEMMKGNGSDKSGHKATLMCSAEQSPSLLTFTWSPNINGQLGPKLIIPLGDEHDNQEYSCTVYNQLSKESATFIAKKCYSGKIWLKHSVHETQKPDECFILHRL